MSPRRLPMEVWAAPLCALLGALPLVRIPAALLLLCLLPGLSVARHWLGIRGPLRLLVLGSLLSLALVPALAIPLGLLLGESSRPLALACPAILALLPALLPRRSAGRPELPPLPWKPLAVICLLALATQVVMTLQIYPEEHTIRWRGLPDLIFFKGIYTQLDLGLPPMDPENGRELLVHNWLYHFHFVQLGQAAGLSVGATQRLASAWMELVLLGILYLLGTEVMGSVAAGVVACLLAMSSGEIYWLVRSVARMEVALDTLPWSWSPLGVTVLAGWYNLAPLAAALGAWYGLEIARRTGSRGWLAASLLLSTAMAFFHPVFYGVFMTAFCLWMATLWLRGERDRTRLLYLLTPLPFFLLYKLPYYGWSMPPSVIHFDPSITGVIDRVQNVALWGGLLFIAGLPGIVRDRRGFPRVLVSLSLLLVLLLETPNPHWFNDLMGLMLALGAGHALASLRRPLVPAAAAVLMIPALLAWGLHVRLALSTAHTFSEHERAAAEWLRDNTDHHDLVTINPNSRSAYTVIGLAGRRVVHGFTGHLLDFKADAREQERAVAGIFRSSDPNHAHRLSHQVDARLLFVGHDEMAHLPAGGLADPHADPVFTSGELRICRVDCPPDCPWRDEKGVPGDEDAL